MSRERETDDRSQNGSLEIMDVLAYHEASSGRLLTVSSGRFSWKMRLYGRRMAAIVSLHGRTRGGLGDRVFSIPRGWIAGVRGHRRIEWLRNKDIGP